MRPYVYILTLGLLIFSSCRETEDKFNGYWKGTVSTKDFEFDKLVYFNNGIAILNNVDFDSFSYEITKKQIHFTPKCYGESFSLNYELLEDSLTMYRDTGDYLRFNLEKISKNLTIKLLSDSKLDIKLSNYSGQTGSVFDLDWPSEFKIFVAKQGDSVVVKHKEGIYPLNLSTFYFLRENIEYDQDSFKRPYHIFMDKELDIESMKLLFYNLRLSLILKPIFIQESTELDSFNYFKCRIGPPNEEDYLLIPDSLITIAPNLPPAPPRPDFKNMDINDIIPIIINPDSVDNANYFVKIKKIVDSNSNKNIVLIDFDNVVNFDTYIKQHSFIFNVISDLRNSYSLRHYNVPFKKLENVDKSVIRDKIRYIVLDARNQEIIDVKYLLQHIRN